MMIHSHSKFQRFNHLNHSPLPTDCHSPDDRRRCRLRQARPAGSARPAGRFRAVRGRHQFAGDRSPVQRCLCCRTTGRPSGRRCRIHATDLQLECGHLLGVHQLPAPSGRLPSVCGVPSGRRCCSSRAGGRSAQVRGRRTGAAVETSEDLELKMTAIQPRTLSVNCFCTRTSCSAGHWFICWSATKYIVPFHTRSTHK